jgi:hypothetical protein
MGAAAGATTNGALATVQRRCGVFNVRARGRRGLEYKKGIGGLRRPVIIVPNDSVEKKGVY